MATLTETFTNIANSIRLKTETTDKITPENMPSMIEGITTGGNVAELSITSNGTYRAPEGIDGYTPVIVNVPQDGSPPAEALVITGDCGYRFANGGWDWFINQYGHQMTTDNITQCNYMFSNSNVKEIPFEINITRTNWSSINFANMFYRALYLETLPKINCSHYSKYDSMNYMFYYCWRLRYLPEDIEDWFDWSVVDADTSQYGFSNNNFFNGCYSLRKIPMGILSHGGPNKGYSTSIYDSLFTACFVLDEVVDLPNPHYNATWGGGSWYNAFDCTFDNCYRLKRLTFKMPDGAPYVVKWNYQIIDLSKKLGWASDNNSIIGYNSGLTTATKITDDATYQQLKDNPDSWTTDINYSRYNRTSAVETINSLPDASAYVAEKGNPNTIKFTGASGALTDGGAINTMTEEEIAVATAKGWTVTFV